MFSTEQRESYSIEDIPQGSHIALLFSDDKKREEIIIRYLKSGFKKKRKILYLFDSPTTEEGKTRLIEKGIRIHEKNFMIDTAENGYCPHGHFSSKEMIHTLENLISQTKVEGYKGIQGSGEMSWALKKMKNSYELMKYESTLNKLTNQGYLTACCQYDCKKFSSKAIMDVLRTHQFLVLSNKVIKNNNYIKPDEFIKNLQNYNLSA